MKTPCLVLPATLLGLFFTLEVQAQVTGSTLQINDSVKFGLAPDYGAFEWRDNGILIAQGQLLSGALLASDEGFRSAFIWHPGKGAILAGYINVTESSIGPYSVALGAGVKATRQGAIAIGVNSSATGEGAISLGGVHYGIGNIASGGQSVALGGLDNSATAGYSSAIGGQFNVASGLSSLVGGNANIASGKNSAAFGYLNRAESFGSFVIGRCNIGGYAPNGNTQWVSTDPLFEIGNGASSAARSNALTVYKNGNATFQGVVRVAPGGDIPMYTGN